MTRIQLRQLAQQLIIETLGSATEGDPIALDSFLSVVTDDIASKVDLYYTPALPVDLVIGQLRYNAPGLYRIKAALVVGPTGKQRPLGVVTPDRMDRLRNATWRNAAPADLGDPAAAREVYAVLEGGNQVRLSPPSSVLRVGALLFEGFGVPGSSWPLDTTECPLPPWSHKAIAYGLAVERTLMYADTVSQARVTRLEARFNNLMTTVAEQAFRFVQGSGVGKETATDDTRFRTRGTTPPPASSQNGNG